MINICRYNNASEKLVTRFELYRLPHDLLKEFGLSVYAIGT
jgi:hypothetical protein